MGIISRIKEVIRRMFKAEDIKRAFLVEASIAKDTLDKLELWNNMLLGSAPWLSDSVASLRLEQGIAREFANVALNEMSVKVTHSKLNELTQKMVDELNENLQTAIALGAMIIKPLGDKGIQYVPQNAFIPIEYDSNGNLTAVIFPEVKKKSESLYYIRLEYHNLQPTGLTIQNKAYKSGSASTLGHEIPLDTVAEWTNLEPCITYPLMTKPAYGYYKNPISQACDNSGVSMYDCAIELIKRADVQFGRIDWEFKSGERAIHVDATALKFDRNKPVMEQLDKRLYRGLNLGGKSGEELLKDFSPEFREQSLISGLEEYKRNIEFAVGLSYGDISNPQTVEKTATEIKSAKKRKYNTVSAIQRNLQSCIEETVYAIAFYNGLTSGGYELIIDFKDSILTDEETERKQDKEDLSLGIMRPEEYRAKWYGEPIEEALKNLPQQASILE